MELFPNNWKNIFIFYLNNYNAKLKIDLNSRLKHYFLPFGVILT